MTPACRKLRDLPERITHITLLYATTPIAHRRDVTQILLLRDPEINPTVVVCYYATPTHSARALITNCKHASSPRGAFNWLTVRPYHMHANRIDTTALCYHAAFTFVLQWEICEALITIGIRAIPMERLHRLILQWTLHSSKKICVNLKMHL